MCDAPADWISALTLLGGALVAITWGGFVYARSLSAWQLSGWQGKLELNTCRID